MIVESEQINIIKSILNLRCREGATITDIENDYYEMIGEPLRDVDNCLNSIASVYCMPSPNKVSKWYVKSANVEHLTKLIMEQKSPQTKPCRSRRPVMNHSMTSNDCFFKDNIDYKNRKRTQNKIQWGEDINNNNFKKETTPTTSPKRSPSQRKQLETMLHAQLVGDDFFRLLSHDESDGILNRKNGVQRNGLCVSGLSIQAAAKLIEATQHFKSNTLIINVGSVDILHGHTFFDLCTDFKKLIKTCENRQLKPILTTLAPLANKGYNREMRILRKFNTFIITEYSSSLKYDVIDIWSEFVNARGMTNFDYYDCEPKYVSGSSCPHSLWNKAGRTLIRDKIHLYLSTLFKLTHVKIDA